MTTDYQIDVARAHESLDAKAVLYKTLWDYYDGVQPLRYSTERLRDIFHNISVRFSQNWCEAVINSSVDRLNLTGLVVENDDSATRLLERLFSEVNLGLESDDVHLASLVCGEAFVIVWRDNGGPIEAYYNDPRLIHIQYDADHPREPLWAAKRWLADDGSYRMTLYYPDRLEYYYTTAKAEDVREATAYRPMETPVETNPFGVIPVFHFRRATREVRSELTDVIPLQDAINKLFADMMVAAEFGAFRQRYVISNADIATLKNSPNEIWSLPSGDGQGQGTQVGEFAQTDLRTYLDAIDRLAATIAIITRTPKHYLLSQGGDPSGEALITMEAPLVRKVERYQERFSATWRQVAAFLMTLSGVDVNVSDITPLFDPVATVQPFTQAQVGVLRKQLGVSQAQIQRELGYTDAQIEAMQIERAQETAGVGEALLSAFDAGEDSIA